MAGAGIRVIFSNPQHGLKEESTSSEILGDTAEMSGNHQHDTITWQSSWLGWLNDNALV